MIIIGKVIVSDEVIQNKFLCNLSKCKGACCVEGESGAPLERSELETLDKVYDLVEPYLTREGIQAIRETGKYIEEKRGVFKTPLIQGQACAYVNYDQLGVAFCGIQKAFTENKIDFEKPVSCHLYPIRIKKVNEFEYVNYEEWNICKPACELGASKKMPLYKFLKEPLTRKYGKEFYQELELAVKHIDTNDV